MKLPALLQRLSVRWPAHVLNGLSVALGIALIHLLSLSIDASAAMWVTGGAIFASLADQPAPWARVWRRVTVAALASCSAAALVAALAPHPLWLGLGIVAIGWAASMTLAWGPKAGPVSFAPMLAVVFTMSLPPGQPVAGLLAWHLAGSGLYMVWLALSNAALRRRYGTLATAAAIDQAAQLLRLRAAMLREDGDALAQTRRLKDWVREELALADRLQAARDLLFTAPGTPVVQRQCALLLRTIDLRDLLLASQLELDQLGRDAAGLRLRSWLSARLDHLAEVLVAQAARVRGDWRLPTITLADEDDAARAGQLRTLLPPDGPQPRERLVPALVRRLRRLHEDVERIQALARGEADPLPLSRAELQQFAVPEAWTIAALRRHLSLRSPVLRHALRHALALACAYGVALWLPWTSHPQWLLISVTVVLRGNLAQTLARRNLRILGTAAGCLLVVGLVAVGSPPLLTAVFLAATGVAHGFVLESYVVTATAATMMSLLQQYLAAPGLGLPAWERLGDTVLGAAMAWAFSFVLPSWERRGLPGLVQQTVTALRDYAALCLGPGDQAVAQRLARRRAYDALVAVGGALQRAGAEPARVRPPVAELAAFLDQGQRLMAHLSMIRVMRLPSQPQGAVDAQQLDRVAGAISGALALETGDAQPAAEAALPPPPDTPAPEAWMHWRLEVTAQAGQRTAEAARRLLQALSRG